MFRGRLRSCKPSRHIRRRISRKPFRQRLGSRTISRIWPSVTVGNTSLRSVEASCASYDRLSAVRSLSEDASKTSVQAFVYPVAWTTATPFFGISEGLMNRLHSVQNAAACLVIGTRSSDHTTPATLATGYRYASASASRLRRSFIGRYLAFHHRSDRT